ncbi:MAG: cysteine desulfurase-like protein [Jatrophihabitans sp.]|uniref:cysteine desulfurase-like protein n=1 Tax=Jatrophihabitans sp. TaxID=1932789 RepID=UPI003F7E17EB
MTELGTSFDVAALRAGFPSLRSGTAHFDGPGGTQTPDAVGRAMYEVITGPLSNRGVGTASERNAEAAVRAGRAAMGDLLGVAADTVVFGRSMTELTMAMARTVARTWQRGDEVVVTRLDHDANIRPWVIAAEAVGAVVRWADFDPATGELGVDDIAAVVGGRTRLVAVTAASNLLGTRPDIAAIASLAHSVGALVYVDGVHSTAHVPTDVAALGADFYACSPYKFLGPHCGVLTGRADLLASLHPDKLLPSTDAVPERFELGTLPYELLAGTAAAVDVLAGLVPAGADADGDRRSRLLASYAALEAHEDRLRHRIETALADLPGVVVRSRAARRTPTLLLTFDGRDAREVAAGLAERGINAPAGSFYALEASRHLGLGDAGGLRVGLAPYTDDSDVDRLIDALRELTVR